MFEYILLAAALWIIQGLLGFWQLRHFNQRFKLLRKEGRVVVGKSKGRIMTGVVIMFCIDQDCNIIKGEKMEGISNFARLHPFNFFNHLNLLELDQQALSSVGRGSRKAIMNALDNYRAFVNIAKPDREVNGADHKGITV